MNKLFKPSIISHFLFKHELNVFNIFFIEFQNSIIILGYLDCQSKTGDNDAILVHLNYDYTKIKPR